MKTTYFAIKNKKTGLLVIVNRGDTYWFDDAENDSLVSPWFSISKNHADFVLQNCHKKDMGFSELNPYRGCVTPETHEVVPVILEWQ